MRRPLIVVPRPRRCTLPGETGRGAPLRAGLLRLISTLLLSGSGLPAGETFSRVLLLDGIVVGTDVIAVGERGTILRSGDQARTWRRTASPVRATLTGVSFATLTAPRLGWAVGHDAVILGSTDAGVTWVKQYQGANLEDSFLDVLALDAQRAIAVGAYGQFQATNDGGKTWLPRKILDRDDHLNRITRGPGTTLYLAGEHGTLLRSPDLGATWTTIATRYEGTFHGIVPLDRRVILAHGLRGHVFRSIDDGESWEPIATPRPALLATGVRLRNNFVVLAGQARSTLVSRDLGRTLTLAPVSLGTGIAELVELPDGAVLALGEAGPVRLELADLFPATPAPTRGSP